MPSFLSTVLYFPIKKMLIPGISMLFPGGISMVFPGGILLNPGWSIGAFSPRNFRVSHFPVRRLLWLGHGGVPAVMC